VSKLPATLQLHDGEQIDATLFVAPGLALRELLNAPRRFLPVESGGRFLLVARDLVACVSVSVFLVKRFTPLPITRRSVVVRLRSGVRLNGDLLYVGTPGYDRIGDHLEQKGEVFELVDGTTAHLVAKRHVAWIEET